MLTVELLLSLLASACAFAGGLLLGTWWERGRHERIVVLASPPMRPPPPAIESGVRSPYAPRPKRKPVAMPAPAERIVRWRTGSEDSPPKPAPKAPDVAVPKAPTIAAEPAGSLLPPIPWGQSCASK